MKQPKNEVYISSSSNNSIESGDIKPCDSLKGYIDCYWYLIANASVISPFKISVTADGSFNIIFNLAQRKISDPIKIYGIPESCISLVASDKTYILGIKFLPGGILSFLDLQASDFGSNSANLSDLIGSRADEIYDNLMLAENLRDKIIFLENYLIGMLNQRRLDVPAVIDKIKLELSRGRLITGEAIADLSCVCERQVRRLFAQYIGVGPNEFIRMLRVQNAIHLLAMKKDVSFKELALMTGHYDQSHFIKEFKKITGITPAQFRRQLTLTRK